MRSRKVVGEQGVQDGIVDAISDPKPTAKDALSARTNLLHDALARLIVDGDEKLKTV